METTTKNVKMDYAATRDAAVILRAFNNKLRTKIIVLLNEKKRMKVTDIYIKLNMVQSVASQHLAVLREANIVIAERDRRSIYYSLNYGRIADIQTFVSNLLATAK